MKKVVYQVILRSIVLQSLLTANVCAQHFQLNSRLDTTSTPARLHIRIQKPGHDLSALRLMSLNDANNTQVLNFYFKGCAPNQMTTYLDTVISIRAPYPFNLRAYTIWDTSVDCPYPPAPLIIDSLFITRGISTTIKGNEKTDELVQVFPNPSKDLIRLKAGNGTRILSVKLINADGALAKEITGSNEEINTANLAKGHYIIEIHTNKGSLQKKVALH